MIDTTTEPRTIKDDVRELIRNSQAESDPFDHDATAEKVIAYFGLIEKRTVATFTVPLLAQGIKAALAGDSGAGVSALDMATTAYHTLHGNGFSVVHSDRLDPNNLAQFLSAVLGMDPASMSVRVIVEGVVAFLTQEVEK